MPKAYPVELRSRVIDAYDAGLSAEKAADQFSVGVRTVYEWLDLRKKTGSITPRDGKRGRKPILEPHADSVRELVRAEPDATLEELCARAPAKVGISTMWATLRRLGLTRKKEGHPRRRAAAA